MKTNSRKAKKINYKTLILKALAEQADLTAETLIHVIGMIFVSKSESYRRLRAVMGPSMGLERGPGARMNFFSRMVSKNAIRVTLTRLKKDGLVKSSGRGAWSLSPAGRIYIFSQVAKNPPRNKNQNHYWRTVGLW